MDEGLKRVIKLIALVPGVLFAIAIGGAGIFSIIHVDLSGTGTGQQIGYIAEVQNHGIVWRPDEIVLIGSEATFSDSQTSWEYASASPEITELSKHYLKSHEKVVVKYETVFLVYGWEYSHTTRITNISVAGVTS